MLDYWLHPFGRQLRGAVYFKKGAVHWRKDSVSSAATDCLLLVMRLGWEIPANSPWVRARESERGFSADRFGHNSEK